MALQNLRIGRLFLYDFAFILCRLAALGHQVGRRLYELNIWRERTAKRETVLLNILLYVSNTFWKSINGKAADSLEKSVENENECNEV